MKKMKRGGGDGMSVLEIDYVSKVGSSSSSFNLLRFLAPRSNKRKLIAYLSCELSSY